MGSYAFLAQTKRLKQNLKNVIKPNVQSYDEQTAGVTMFIIVYALKGLFYIIIADAILSWIQPEHKMPRSITSSITTPLYKPIHSVLKPSMTGGLDLSPIVILFGLQFLIGILS